MNRVESTPEQPIQTPTEASKEFLGGWGASVIVGLNFVNVGAQSFLAGINMAQGDSDRALVHGLVAGGSSLVVVLHELARHIEIQFFCIANKD
ncbi:MAG: hypothetical protein HY431_02870 [Candidatus Levybacteria bacterium]|nr:hypothetical protein [Candidatus Levybacteria bacterium]